MNAFKYLQSGLPSIVVITGNLLGGQWAMGNIYFSLILMVIVDFASGSKSGPQNIENEDLPNFILIAATGLQAICVGSLLFGISSGVLTDQAITWAAISTGLNSGLIGITSAHELIHRKNRVFRALGVFSLIQCCYGHFYVEHKKGHHAHVGTKKDPATARKGEMFYAFLIRSVAGQWISGFKIEQARLKRINSGIWSGRNFVVNITCIEIGFIVLLYFWIGKDAAYSFVLQAVVAFVLLEYVNYIEHYGLQRSPGEKVGPQHAWQSDSATSRHTLFELSRHSHHHMDATVPYHKLEAFQHSNQLPFGYYGMFYIALIPPLWFWVMDKKVPIQHQL